MKKPIFLMLMLMFSFSVFGISQSSEWNFDQLTVINPKNNFFEYSSSFNFTVSVVNSTGGLLSNSVVDCDVNIYDFNDDLVFSESMVDSSNGFDLIASLNSDVTGVLGIYYYNIFCDSNGLYGFISSDFEVTPDGKSYNDKNILWLSIILVIIFISVSSLMISNMIEAPEFFNLKRLLFLYGLFTSFLVPIFPMLMSAHPSVSGLSEAFVGYFIVSVFVMFASIIFYWLGWTKKIVTDGFNDLRGKGNGKKK